MLKDPKVIVVMPAYNAARTLRKTYDEVMSQGIIDLIDFVFDNQMLAQIIWLGYTIAEISCPTKYFAEASSINLQRSIKYGFGCLHTVLTFRI